jgi:hypothetical protein
MKSKYPGTAWFSDDGVYRWELTRENLGPGDPCPLVDIGLNPSTADHEEDDRTIAKGILYAIAWGCNRLVKCNAYAYCTKDPKIMFAAKRAGVDIVGVENDFAITRAVQLALGMGGKVLVSWGGNIEPYRQERLVEMLDGVPLWCVKRNEDKWGTPKHFLYEKNDAKPIPWKYHRR